LWLLADTEFCQLLACVAIWQCYSTIQLAIIITITITIIITIIITIMIIIIVCSLDKPLSGC